MSAFILSDLHFSTIAIYIHYLDDNIGIQELADKLKSINIDSVNYRYGEKTRKAKNNKDFVGGVNQYAKDIDSLVVGINQLIK